MRTRLVNPSAVLIPKLERLGVSIATIAALKNNTITSTAFLELLPQHRRQGAFVPAGQGDAVVAEPAVALFRHQAGVLLSGTRNAWGMAPPGCWRTRWAYEKLNISLPV